MMENTGERLLTEDHYETTIEHLHRYAFALQYVNQKNIIDIASGEGYGSNLLASQAASVIGVDIDKEAVEHAQHKYKRNNLQYKIGSADKIPVEEKSVDVVVSFETIEHHDRHHEMLKEIKRILKDDGILIISSPDKYYYSDLPKFKNQFHVKELYFEEFKNLISLYFTHHTYCFQRFGYNSIINTEKDSSDFYEFSGSFEKIDKNPNISNPVYNLVIASQSPVIKNFNSVFTADEIIHNKITQLEKREQDCHIYYKGIIEEYKNSNRYKLGSLIIAPFHYVKTLFAK